MFVAFLKFLMRWFQRLVVLALLVLLGIWLFYIGREHQIFLDNKPLGDFKALEQVNVSINGGEPVEIMSRERDVKKIVGPKFDIKAEIFNEDGELENTVMKTVRVCFSKDIMINLPAFAAEDESFIVNAPR